MSMVGRRHVKGTRGTNLVTDLYSCAMKTHHSSVAIKCYAQMRYVHGGGGGGGVMS